MQSMLMSVLSCNSCSPTFVSPQTESDNILCSSNSPAVHQHSKVEGISKEECGLAGQLTSRYPNPNPATYHQLKYNNWSPSSCSSGSNSPSSPFTTQKQAAKSDWNDFNFSEWFEEQLSSFKQAVKSDWNDFNFSEWFEEQLSSFNKKENSQESN